MKALHNDPKLTGFLNLVPVLFIWHCNSFRQVFTIFAHFVRLNNIYSDEVLSGKSITPNRPIAGQDLNHKNIPRILHHYGDQLQHLYSI